MSEKLDAIHEEVTETRIAVGKIEEHLKLLNGTVGRNCDDIKALQKFNYKLAGGIAVIVFVADFIIRYALKV